MYSLKVKSSDFTLHGGTWRVLFFEYSPLKGIRLDVSNKFTLFIRR